MAVAELLLSCSAYGPQSPSESGDRDCMHTREKDCEGENSSNSSVIAIKKAFTLALYEYVPSLVGRYTFKSY